MVNNFAIALKVRILTEYAELWTRVELKCACQVFDVGYAYPCKGSAPHPDVTGPCLSTCDGEHQSGPQIAFTPPRCSLSPLSLSQLSPSLSTAGTRARSPWPPLPVARAPRHRIFCHPCGPSTLADHPGFFVVVRRSSSHGAASRCRPRARHGRWCSAP
jgi:hypothetical protein